MVSKEQTLEASMNSLQFSYHDGNPTEGTLSLCLGRSMGCMTSSQPLFYHKYSADEDS